MTLVITESEMLERYIDGLKKAESRAKEFTVEPLSERPRIFIDFIDALKIAAGSAHQLAHSQMNTKWLDTRDIIEGIITVGGSLPIHKEADNYLWLRIKDSLENMMVTGRKLATSRAMTNPELQINLDARFAALKDLPN